MFRHHAHRITLPALLLSLALAGCADDDPQGQIDSLRDALATVNSEATSLRASRRVLQTRLAAAQIAARTAGDRLHHLNTKIEQITAREASLARTSAQGTQRLRAAESTIAQLQAQLAGANRALNASNAKSAALTRQLAAVSGWLGQRDALSQSQDNTLKNLQGDLKRRTSSLTTLSEQLRTQKETLQRTRAEAVELRASNKQLDTRFKALKTKFDKLSAQAGKASDEAATTQADTQQLSANNEQFKADLELLRDKLADANNNALRYQAAKDYLVEQVQAKEKELTALKQTADNAGARHNKTIAALFVQQDELKAAAKKNTEALRQQVDRNTTLETEANNARTQIKQLQSDNAASEERARGAARAKDYLDGKLASTSKELADTRKEHRLALLKVEQALRLSVEEARVLQQRESAMRKELELAQATAQRSTQQEKELQEQLKLAQQTAQQRIQRENELQEQLKLAQQKAQQRTQSENELREQLKLAQQSGGEDVAKLREQISTSEKDMDELNVRIGMFERTFTYLKDREAKHDAQMSELRDEFATKLDTAQSQIQAAAQAQAAAEAQAKSCLSSRQADNDATNDLQQDNKTLLRYIETLETRLGILEAAQNQCKLQKTAL